MVSLAQAAEQAKIDLYCALDRAMFETLIKQSREGISYDSMLVVLRGTMRTEKQAQYLLLSAKNANNLGLKAKEAGIAHEEQCLEVWELQGSRVN